MTTHAAPIAPTTVAPTSSRRHFFDHYLEMIAVMLVSMMVLSGLFWGIVGILRHGNLGHFLRVRAS